MTISQIREAQAAKLDAQAAIIGEHADLNQTQLDAITDEQAEVLETVNPTTTYPPTGR